MSIRLVLDANFLWKVAFAVVKVARPFMEANHALLRAVLPLSGVGL